MIIITAYDQILLELFHTHFYREYKKPLLLLHGKLTFLKKHGYIGKAFYCNLWCLENSYL